MLVLINKLILVPKDCGWIPFMLSFAFYQRLHSQQPGAHERGKHDWTQVWSEWWDRLWLHHVAHHSKGTLLTSPSKLNLHKEEWFLCTSHFSLSFFGGRCGLETSGTHRVWKGVHQCHSVSHRIKCCQQRCTTDAALFSCGPSEGERWASTKNPYVCSLPSNWFVCAFQLPVTACQASYLSHMLSLWHCQHPGSPTYPTSGFGLLLQKGFEVHRIKNHWQTLNWKLISQIFKNLETHLFQFRQIFCSYLGNQCSHCQGLFGWRAEHNVRAALGCGWK